MASDITSGDPRVDAADGGIDTEHPRTLRRTVRSRVEAMCADDRGALPLRGIHRVLIARVSHTLGNTLLITPLIREIERIYPGAEIDIITRSAVAKEVFASFDRVRTIHALPDHAATSPLRIAGVLCALRNARYDLAIDPGVLSRTDRLCVRLARARWKIGYACKPSRGLTHAISVPIGLRHVGKLPVHLLRAARNEASSDGYPRLDIALSAAECEQGRATLDEIVAGEGPVVGFFTAATADKALGAEWWQALVAHFRKRMPRVRSIEIVPLAGSSLLDHWCPTFYSTDLRRLAAVISRLSRFVVADCGVMHLACAAGAPTVGLFRGTAMEEWGPYGARDLAFDTRSMPPHALAGVLSALPEMHGRLPA